MKTWLWYFFNVMMILIIAVVLFFAAGVADAHHGLIALSLLPVAAALIATLAYSVKCWEPCRCKITNDYCHKHHRLAD